MRTQAHKQEIPSLFALASELWPDRASFVLTRRVRNVLTIGRELGEQGMYPDQDFSSHADQVYGSLAEIRAIAEAYAPNDMLASGEIEQMIFDAYREQHSLGLAIGGHETNDNDEIFSEDEETDEDESDPVNIN